LNGARGGLWYTQGMEQLETTLVEDEAYRLAARLLAVQHAVAEITGGHKVDADPEALRDAVYQIKQAVRKVEGAYVCFIGGLAVQHHGWQRWTDVIDVVVDAEHYREVLDELRSRGFAITTNWNLVNRETGAKVDFLKEGITMKSARFPLPHPSELGPNTGHAKLSWLVRLKLEAQRARDFADIVEVLKRNLGQVDAVCAELPEVMREKFTELAQQARREMEP